MSYKLLLNIFYFFYSAYDCGVFVIATAEHLCKELCEGYNIPLIEMVTQKSVTEARQKIKDLIYQTAKDYSGSWVPLIVRLDIINYRFWFSPNELFSGTVLCCIGLLSYYRIMYRVILNFAFICMA